KYFAKTCAIRRGGVEPSEHGLRDRFVTRSRRIGWGDEGRWAVVELVKQRANRACGSCKTGHFGQLRRRQMVLGGEKSLADRIVRWKPCDAFGERKREAARIVERIGRDTEESLVPHQRPGRRAVFTTMGVRCWLRGRGGSAKPGCCFLYRWQSTA